MLVEPRHLDQMLHPQFLDESAYKHLVIAAGLAASPGAAVGQICFTSEEAVAFQAKGGMAILVREETSPDDIAGECNAGLAHAFLYVMFCSSGPLLSHVRASYFCRSCQFTLVQAQGCKAILTCEKTSH